MTTLPWYDGEGARLLHLGFSYRHGFRDNSVEFGTRPESHLYPVELVDTGSIDSDSFDRIDPEVAVVRGPLSLQDEYMCAFVAHDDVIAGLTWYLNPSALIEANHIRSSGDGRRQQRRAATLPVRVLSARPRRSRNFHRAFMPP